MLEINEFQVLKELYKQKNSLIDKPDKPISMNENDTEDNNLQH